jgi:hypothetical protein
MPNPSLTTGPNPPALTEGEVSVEVEIILWFMAAYAGSWKMAGSFPPDFSANLWSPNRWRSNPWPIKQKIQGPA